jgi:F-type H+-transporting ATPase subunit b
MKLLQRKHLWKIGLFSLVLILYTFAGFSFASEVASNDWRGTYDLVMRWLNFIILAAVIVKFGAKPIKSFIGQQRTEISTEISLLEKEKKEMEAKVDQTLKMGDDRQIEMKNLKKRILTEGERRKYQIIEDAKLQSSLMIEEAKRKVEQRIYAARKNFRKELIDAATDIALQKLPMAITKEDQEKRLAQFLSTIDAT